MQATADPAGTLTSSSIIYDERRPVRLLVPTVRRTPWFVPQEDTLRASDLGLTRDTVDGQIVHMVRAARKMLRAAHITEDPETYLRRIRDGLRHPRDIAEAREWGMIVPPEQNTEEFLPDAGKRTGWWWVLDPTRTETQAEREDRLLADTRLIGMKGVARVFMRTYITTKDFKMESDRVRRMLRDRAYLRAEAIKRLAKGKGVRAAPHAPAPAFRPITALVDDVSQADAEAALDEVDLTGLVDPGQAWTNLADVEATMAAELAYARRFVHKAMPPRRDRIDQSDVWYVGDACRIGRDTTRLNEWYEYNKVRQTGRPPGSKTQRHRPRSVEVAG